MKCRYCNSQCIKAGRQSNGRQKYRCNRCGKYQQALYTYPACGIDIRERIIAHVKEGCGIRNTARLLRVGVKTVVRRIKHIARHITIPNSGTIGGIVEVDEMWTFIGSKANDCFVSYAYDRGSNSVIAFRIGSRTKENLKGVVDIAKRLNPKSICTDGLNIYPGLVSGTVHKVGSAHTRRIERNNLTMRTNLKRLSRKTICFSRSMEMLEASIKIFFWA